MSIQLQCSGILLLFILCYFIFKFYLILKFLYVADVHKMLTYPLPQYIRQEQTDHHSQGTVNSSHDFRLWRVDRVTSWLAPVLTVWLAEQVWLAGCSRTNFIVLRRLLQLVPPILLQSWLWVFKWKLQKTKFIYREHKVSFILCRQYAACDRLSDSHI